MIQQTYSNNVEQVSAGVQTTGFNIEINESMFQLLTSNIYNDPALAVVREWSTNACDACIVAGKEVKFDVHLPTLSETYFHVRDYGTGLSPEDVTGLFSNLGASTKRDSNELNGTLGIGRMAGLAVANAFTVDSYYHGKQYSYAISMQNGIPVTMFIGESTTDEPNGLKLSVSLDYADIAQYTEKATKLYKYFDYKPNVNIDLDIELDTSGHISDSWFIQRDSSNGYNRTNYVVMSQIAYAIPANSAVNDFGFTSLIIKAEPGSVTFNPGRESLSLNKTTIAYLNTRFKEVREEYVLSATLAMAECTTDKDLMACYHKVVYDVPRDVREKVDPTPFTSVAYQQLFAGTYGNNILTYANLTTGDAFRLATADKLILTQKDSYYKTSKELTNRNTMQFTEFFNANHVIIDVKTKYKTALSTKFDRKHMVCWQRKEKNDIDSVVQTAKDYLDSLGLSYYLASDIIKEVGLDVTNAVAPREGLFASKIDVKRGDVLRSTKVDMLQPENKVCLYLKLSNTTPELKSTTVSFEEYLLAYDLLSRSISMPAIKGVAKKYQSFADSLDDWVDFETYIEEKMKETTFKVPLSVEVPSFNGRVIHSNNLYRYPEAIQNYYTEVVDYHNYNKGPTYANTPLLVNLMTSFGSSTTSYTPSIEIDMDYLTKTYPTSLPMLNGGSGYYGMPDDIVIRVATLENHYAIHSTK
jgi:hypothetical protein